MLRAVIFDFDLTLADSTAGALDCTQSQEPRLEPLWRTRMDRGDRELRLMCSQQIGAHRLASSKFSN